MGNGYWVIRTYRCGQMEEKIKFWIQGERPTRSERRLKAEIKKQQSNEACAVKRVNRLLHAYFDHRDWLLTVEYSDEKRPTGADQNETWEKAKHQQELWFDRIRKECKKQGVELRYLAFTSDMDGETGEMVNVHHHVVINREALEIAMQKWGKGFVHAEHIWEERDHMGLAQYLMNQVRRIEDAKKYTRSRNMPDPKPQDKIAKNGAELRAPKGTYMLYRGPYIPGWPQYIRYWRPPTDGPGEGG